MSEEVQDAQLVVATGQPDLHKASRIQFEAVAKLLESAYSKDLILTPEESKLLQADFPDEAFKTGAAGKEHLIYIEHANLRDRLNEVLGLGQWRLLRIRSWDDPFSHEKWENNQKVLVEGIKVYFEGVLTIRGAYVGCAIGDMDYYPKNNSTNYGDAYEGAKTAAFRRCAKEFGVGLQAWRKEFGEGWFKRRGQTPRGQDAQFRQGLAQDVKDGQARHAQQQAKKAETNSDAVINSGKKEEPKQEQQQQSQPQGQYVNYECPRCGVKAVGRSKYPPRNRPNDPCGWHCYERSGGCKANFNYDDVDFKQYTQEQEKPKEEDHQGDEFVDGWRDWAKKIGPDLEAFNSGYHQSIDDLKALDRKVQIKVWGAIVEIAHENGWEFSKEAKSFVKKS